MKTIPLTMPPTVVDPGEEPGGPAPPPPPHIWTKLRPKGPRKYIFKTAPPQSQVLDDGPLPPYLKVWIHH